MSLTNCLSLKNYSLSPEFCIITAQAPSEAKMTAPINFGKLLPGSTLIRELIAICPCSVYPSPKSFMESSGNPLRLIRLKVVPSQNVGAIKHNSTEL
ncbi:hypothetical protein CEXT_458341 [Caerostris extrusa]|uniref:Uncharacterized protein n=1 Tax=Caerostris extrusa TaxID=172846 RepID=A0AAV4T493_CAEEX|nr:hypothetical protein CEXT_458341 [Caerostris extrusa]